MRSRRSLITGRLLGSILTSAMALTSCGTGAAFTTLDATTKTTGRTQPGSPATLALVMTDAGLAGVRVGISQPLWTDGHAVAAADASAVFTAQTGAINTALLRLDPRTGEEIGAWTLEGTLTVGAVAPNGKWVALVERPAVPVGHAAMLDGPARTVPTPAAPGTTTLVVFDPNTGREGTPRLHLDGDIEPEAFSVDGRKVFALRRVSDHYRVDTIDLQTGSQRETATRETAALPDPTKKFIGEDMFGTAVQAVLSADHGLLVTLYRNPMSTDEPAFVHVLDLVNGWSYCADLPQPFGTPGPKVDVIELRSGGSALVGDAQENTVAELDVQAVHVADTSVPVALDIRRDDNPPSLPEGLTDVPGFRRLLAFVP